MKQKETNRDRLKMYHKFDRKMSKREEGKRC